VSKKSAKMFNQTQGQGGDKIDVSGKNQRPGKISGSILFIPISITSVKIPDEDK